MARQASWTGLPSVKGRSEFTRMFLLTLSLIGITFTWGTEMTYGTPYLLQLGLSKSRTSAVWIAGPLSGLIVQPIIGVLADRSTSKYGRRRPFMVAGSAFVAAFLIVLGWAPEIIRVFIGDEEKEQQSLLTLALAIMSIYVIDFAINAVQACARSLVVDTLPVSRQAAGSAWVTRMGGAGHLIIYGAGAIDLPKTFGTGFGQTQLKQMIVLSAVSLLFTVGVTCWATTERLLVEPADDAGASDGPIQMLLTIYRRTTRLPNRIQAICNIQFLAWVGWFPFLCYGSTWLGEIYFRHNAPDALKGSKDVLGEMGRVGSLGLVVFSTMTVAGSVFLPSLIDSPGEEKGSFTVRPPPGLATVLKKLHARRPTLDQAWTYSHLMFAAAMLLAPFVRSLRFAIFCVAASGIPWAFAGWAPLTFMGIEINRLASHASYQQLPLDAPSINDLDGDPAAPPSPELLHLNHIRTDSRDAGHAHSSTGEMAGVYLGILNVYTTLPQFVGTFISMTVFAIFEPGKSREFGGSDETEMTDIKEGYNAISICLFVGGMCVLAAAWKTKQLPRVR